MNLRTHGASTDGVLRVSRSIALPRSWSVPRRGWAEAPFSVPPLGFWVGCVATAAGYYLAAHIAYAFAFAGPVASVVWPPVGVGILALYLGGLRLWPGILIGDLLVNNYATIPIGAAIGQTTGNVLEVVLAAYLLRRLIPDAKVFSSTRAVLIMFGAIAAATLLSATVGPLWLLVGGTIHAGALPRVSAAWWLGDFCGAALVVPAVLAWKPGAAPPVERPRLAEVIVVLTVLVALSLVGALGSNPVSYLAFPPMIWAAIRLGPRGASVAILVGTAFVIWGATHSFSDFAIRSIDQTLFQTQVFLAVSAVCTVLAAAWSAERMRLAEATQAPLRRIVLAADEERRRIEHNLHDGAQARLAALNVRLSFAADVAARDPQTVVGAIETAQHEVLAALEELRELVHGIHPSLLRNFGLARALEDVAARSTIPVELDGLTERRLDQLSEVTAYYVVLEAITNALRHSGASAIRVRAVFVGHTLSVEVADDGVGGAVERGNLGIQGLRDRVEATGGRFRVESHAGYGTRVSAQIPAHLAAG